MAGLRDELEKGTDEASVVDIKLLGQVLPEAYMTEPHIPWSTILLWPGVDRTSHSLAPPFCMLTIPAPSSSVFSPFLLFLTLHPAGASGSGQAGQRVERGR
jgi:hypothetical protein